MLGRALDRDLLPRGRRPAPGDCRTLTYFELHRQVVRAAAALADLGVAAGDLEPPADASDEGLAQIEAEAAEISAWIERLGPVNVLALEEYNEEARRLEFLTVQRDDLLRSIQDLQDSIRKINATSSARFQAAFAAINADESLHVEVRRRAKRTVRAIEERLGAA